MPPKPQGKASAKAKGVSSIADLHIDVDLKKLSDNLSRAKAPMEPIAPFIKTVKTELQKYKDGEEVDIPQFPLFIIEPVRFETSKALFAVLEPYPWLRQISLFHCRIGDDGAMVVAEFLKRYKPHPERNPFGIEVLELPENDIGARGAGYLGRVLTQNESVKVLNLDFNPLGDEGAVNLGDGLKWNSTLEKLTMKYCDIREAGGEAVGKFIVRSSSVKDLSLRGNQLGPHGITHIAHALAKNAYLVRLDIADTGFGIDIEAIEALRDGMESNDSLEGVDMNYNSLVPAGAQLLLEMLKAKPKLVQFDVYERISEAVFKDVLDTVQANVKALKKRKKGGASKKKKEAPAEDPGAVAAASAAAAAAAPPTATPTASAPLPA